MIEENGKNFDKDEDAAAKDRGVASKKWVMGSRINPRRSASLTSR